MKPKEVLFITVSIFIVVIAYIGFNIYHNYKISTISPALSIQIAPIDPSFDTRTIKEAKKRNKITPDLSANSSASTAAQVLNLIPAQTAPTPQQSTSSSIIKP